MSLSAVDQSYLIKISETADDVVEELRKRFVSPRRFYPPVVFISSVFERSVCLMVEWATAMPFSRRCLP